MYEWDQNYSSEDDELTDCDDCGKDITKDQAYIWTDVLVICKDCKPKKEAPSEQD
jgi:hypothetical protein